MNILPCDEIGRPTTGVSQPLRFREVCLFKRSNIVSFYVGTDSLLVLSLAIVQENASTYGA